MSFKDLFHARVAVFLLAPLMNGVLSFKDGKVSADLYGCKLQDTKACCVGSYYSCFVSKFIYLAQNAPKRQFYHNFLHLWPSMPDHKLRMPIGVHTTTQFGQGTPGGGGGQPAAFTPAQVFSL